MTGITGCLDDGRRRIFSGCSSPVDGANAPHVCGNTPRSCLRWGRPASEHRRTVSIRWIGTDPIGPGRIPDVNGTVGSDRIGLLAWTWTEDRNEFLTNSNRACKRSERIRNGSGTDQEQIRNGSNGSRTDPERIYETTPESERYRPEWDWNDPEREVEVRNGSKVISSWWMFSERIWTDSERDEAV